MAGNILWNGGTITTVTSAGASLTNLSGASAGTFDCTNASAGNGKDMLVGRASLTVQWATITNITAGVVAGLLYLLPAIDGTNYPGVDTTAGASHFPSSAYVGRFPIALAPTASTNILLDCNDFELRPWLYTVYLLNQSGQTMSANWTLKIMVAQAQYT